jgi:hypothetical protein
VEIRYTPGPVDEGVLISISMHLLAPRSAIAVRSYGNDLFFRAQVLVLAIVVPALISWRLVRVDCGL